MEIHLAARDGKLEEVKEAMRGASLQDKNYALFFASRNNHFEIVKYLVEGGVKPYAHGALLVAAARGNFKIFKFLFERGAFDADIIGKSFFNAVQFRRDEIVEFVINDRNMGIL